MARWVALLVVGLLAACGEDGAFPDQIISRPTIGVELDPAAITCPVGEGVNRGFC